MSTTTSATTLTVVQYNALADALCTGDDAGFTSLPPAKLAWSSRGDAVVRALAASDADVLCLQEVDHFHDTLYPALAALGYGGCYKEDEWSPCRKLSAGTLRDGVAIFYRREKLELCGMHAPCTPRAAKDVAVEEDGSANDAGKCLVARFRVLPPRELTHGDRWAEHTCATEEVVVATVHLDAAKNQEGAAKRRRQAARCVRAVREFRDFSCSQPEVAAVIVAGDLNAAPHEPAVAIFKSGGSNDDAKVDGDLRMFSAYERASGTEPPFTTWKIRSGDYKPGEAKMTIDYIFLSRGCEVKEIGRLDDEAAIGAQGLPCPAHPSDHLMLRAVVRLPPPPPILAPSSSRAGSSVV